MVQIILNWNPEQRADALAAGFREETVLVKEEACQSTPENKQRLEKECFSLHPYRFAVTDTWGCSMD